MVRSSIYNLFLLVVTLTAASCGGLPIDQNSGREAVSNDYMSPQSIEGWIKKYLSENLVPDEQVEKIREGMKAYGFFSPAYDIRLLADGMTDQQKMAAVFDSLTTTILAGDFPNKTFLLGLTEPMLVKYFSLRERKMDDFIELVEDLTEVLTQRLADDPDMAEAVLGEATRALSGIMKEIDNDAYRTGLVVGGVVNGAFKGGAAKNSTVMSAIAGAGMKSAGSNLDIIKSSFTTLMKAVLRQVAEASGDNVLDPNTINELVTKMVASALRNLGGGGDDLVAALKKIANDLIAGAVEDGTFSVEEGGEIANNINGIDVSTPGSSVSPPGAFTISTPAGPQFSTSVTVAFSASTGAEAYDVTIGSNSNCSSVIKAKQDQTSTSVTFTDLSNGSYYVCVVAHNSSSTTTKASNNGLAFSVSSERFYLMYTAQDTGDDLVLRYFDGVNWSAESVVVDNSYVRPMHAFGVSGTGEIHYASRDSAGDKLNYNNQAAGSFVGETDIPKLGYTANGLDIDLSIDSTGSIFTAAVRFPPTETMYPQIISHYGSRSGWVDAIAHDTQPTIDSVSGNLATAIDANDNRFMAFGLGSLGGNFTLIKDTGAGWTAPTSFPAGDCNGYQSFDMVTDDSLTEGKVHALAICVDINSNCYATYITNRTGSFTTTSIATIDGTGAGCAVGSQATIYLDSTQEPHVVFKTSSHELWYMFYNGTSWSSPTRISAGPVYYPSLAIGSNDQIIISYLTAALGGANSLGTAYNNGGGWNFITPVTFANNPRFVSELKATATRGQNNFP